MNDIRRDQEDARLAALDRYDLMDTPADASFDRITRLAQNALNVPIAAVSLIDGHRAWVKSMQGLVPHDCGKEHSFCAVAIQQSEPLLVEDATADARFDDNPFVLGAPHIRAYAGAQLRTPDGFKLGALCAVDTKPRQFDAKDVAVLKDLADVVMAEFEAQMQARTDALTGTLTRRAFREQAESAIALGLRHGHPSSCVMFDLDHFKAINDAHGHAVGDEVLVAVTEACRKRLRASDILGRIGGEEFAMVLPHTNAAGALKLCDEIRLAIAETSTAVPRFAVSASFGISGLERLPVPLDELLRRADMALYEAKASGRNTCVAWKAPVDPTIMRRVLKAGQIVFNGGRSVVDCTVRGLSAKGACVDVVSTAGIPATFKLAIPGDSTSRACNITGKQDRRIEVAFA